MIGKVVEEGKVDMSVGEALSAFLHPSSHFAARKMDRSLCWPKWRALGSKSQGCSFRPDESNVWAAAGLILSCFGLCRGVEATNGLRTKTPECGLRRASPFELNIAIDDVFKTRSDGMTTACQASVTMSHSICQLGSDRIPTALMEIGV